MNRRELLVGMGAISASACAATETARQIADPRPATQWKKLTTEPYRGKQDDIHFISRPVGWYGNGEGKLYRTADAGETWSKVWERPGTFIRALGFINAANGFLGNVGVDYYPNVTDTQPLHRTRDGGASWVPVEVEGAGWVKGICGIDILQRRAIFQGELKSTPIIHAAGRVGGPPAILRSTDGGETWCVIDMRPHCGMILDVKFFDEENGLVCAASSDDLEQSNALMLQTRDGGSTWREAYRSARRFENCWKMSFPSRSVGYATVQTYDAAGDPQRRIVKTTDGGTSWREVPLVVDGTLQQFGVGFVNETWGWVGGSTSGFETRDGGATWAPVAMGRAVNKVRIISNSSGVTAYAIGVDVYRLDI